MKKNVIFLFNRVHLVVEKCEKLDERTFSLTATLRTFHKNSKIAMKKAKIQPKIRSTKTPPTLAMPSLSFSASSTSTRSCTRTVRITIRVRAYLILSTSMCLEYLEAYANLIS